MSRHRKAFLIWLAIMVPAVIALAVIGMTCDTCQRTDLDLHYRVLPN